MSFALKNYFFMLDKTSRCVNREYFSGVISGTIFSILKDHISKPEIDPNITDLELTNLIT